MTRAVGMFRIRLRYVVEDIDRFGNVRVYFRQKGKPKIRLHGLPGSDEFMSAYRAALSGAEAVKQYYQRATKGSFGYVCQRYYASTTFAALDVSTKAWRRRALDAICANHGTKPVSKMQAKHIRMLRDEKASLPGAARNRLKALRALFRWAIEEGEAPHDPTIGVDKIVYVTKGHHSWSIEEITAYERRHPLGTKARLAMAILLYTSWRREDAVRLGPQHIRGGRIKYRQAKNEGRRPIDMDIPLHPDLAEAIASLPSTHLTFLVTEYGKPFTANGFGNAFKDWCRQANLPHCSAHGLRKALATRLAESGATPHEIMAITGHQSLDEVERYTRAAQKSHLADTAMTKLIK